jgi:outer membrane protein insertion porin family
MMTSWTAERKFCALPGIHAPRASKYAAFFLLLAASSPAWARKQPSANSATAGSALILGTLNSRSNDAASGSEASRLRASESANSVAGWPSESSSPGASGEAAQSNLQDNSGQPRIVVDRIEFIGNRRIRSDTLKARIFSRDGDPYNEDTLRRDFQALWNTQFFEDVKLRVEDSPDRANAKIIIFEVKERPVIRRIRYEGIHSISESDILDRFKEKKVGLTVESQFDPTKIKKAEVVLQDLLGEHGHQFAEVTPQYERIASSNAVILVFKINEGPKVKVGKIIFVGNHAFSNRKLIRAMHHDRPYAIPLYITEINVLSKTYDKDKLNEDLEVGIKGIYQDNGYFKVSIPDPTVENVDTDGYKLGVPLPFAGKKPGKAVEITIHIEEGEQYHMGTLKIVSADPDKALSLKVEALKNLWPIKKGEIFSADKVRKALKNYTAAYGEFGFIDFTPEPETEVDDATKTINVTLKFDEQKQYYVRRIDFSGNTTTRDKVIRRELLIDEGQLFNKRLWEISILRLNQLNYFERIEADKAAEIKRNPKDGTVDLTLKLREKGKQSIGLQGGVSGLAGTFVGLTYQTNNFLGLGETLTLSAQFGDLQRSFTFGFTEPYLFDKPYQTGFTIFSSRYNFNQAKQLAQAEGQAISINPEFVQNYSQNSTGFTTYISHPLRKLSFTRVSLTYGLTRTDITAFNSTSSLLFTDLKFRSVEGPSALDGIVASTITPSITRNTINNPQNPTTGKSYFYSAAFSGLGGNVKSISNTFDYKMFKPTYHKRNVIGVHFSASFITGFGGEDVPAYSRYYMGGENDLRGYDIRSVSPVTFIPTMVSQSFSYFSNQHLSGNGGSTLVTFAAPILAYSISFPGGDTQTYGNFEYRIPIAGPVTAALFIDAGTVGIVNTSGLRLDPTGVANLEALFPLATVAADPKLTSHLSIANGTNFRPRASTGIEFVVQLPIIQAPFRIYYAYNVNRLHEQIFSPQDYIDPGERAYLKSSLPAAEYNFIVNPLLNTYVNNPGSLNYFEPLRTFRFTVSRTF